MKVQKSENKWRQHWTRAEKGVLLGSISDTLSAFTFSSSKWSEKCSILKKDESAIFFLNKWRQYWNRVEKNRFIRVCDVTSPQNSPIPKRPTPP